MNGYEDPRRTVFLPHARMSRLKDSIVESGRELASLIAIIWVVETEDYSVNGCGSYDCCRGLVSACGSRFEELDR